MKATIKHTCIFALGFIMISVFQNCSGEVPQKSRSVASQTSQTPAEEPTDQQQREQNPLELEKSKNLVYRVQSKIGPENQLTFTRETDVIVRRIGPIENYVRSDIQICQEYVSFNRSESSKGQCTKNERYVNAEDVGYAYDPESKYLVKIVSVKDKHSLSRLGIFQNFYYSRSLARRGNTPEYSVVSSLSEINLIVSHSKNGLPNYNFNRSQTVYRRLENMSPSGMVCQEVIRADGTNNFGNCNNRAHFVPLTSVGWTYSGGAMGIWYKEKVISQSTNLNLGGSFRGYFYDPSTGNTIKSRYIIIE